MRSRGNGPVNGNCEGYRYNCQPWSAGAITAGTLSGALGTRQNTLLPA